MTHDHADELSIRPAITETQRTAEFKTARSDFIGKSRQLYEAYQLGMLDHFGSYKFGKTEFGVPSVTDNIKTDPDSTTSKDRTERTIGFDELAFGQYEEGQDYEFGGQTDVVASFEETTFNETTRQFERLGWIVWGDGSVDRLTSEVRDGKTWNVSRKTNDTMDLQAANDYLSGVIRDTVTPDPIPES